MLFFLQETHLKVMDEEFWSNQRGDKIFYRHGTNRSAGVVTLFYSFSGMVLATNRDTLGHCIICVIETNDTFLILRNICGSNSPNQNKTMIFEMTDCKIA